MKSGFLSCLALSTICAAQDPYALAPENYKLEFANEWVRVSRAVFTPGMKLARHDHPSGPTIYVYATDGGEIRFTHGPDFILVRPAVKAGGVRFNRGNKETHEVEYLGAEPSEYFRIELRTEPLEIPRRDIRLKPPAELRPGTTVEFENAQVRIVRVVCAGECVVPEAKYPAVVISIPERKAMWADATVPGSRHQVRLELKSRPMGLVTAP